MPDKITTSACELKCSPKVEFSGENTHTNTSTISQKMRYAQLIKTSHRSTYTTANKTLNSLFKWSGAPGGSGKGR